MNANHAILLGGGAQEGGDGFSVCVEQQKLERATSMDAIQAAQPFYQQSLWQGAVVNLSNVVSKRDWEGSAYYNEFIRPMNGYYGLVAGRMQYPSDPFTIAICR